MYKPAIFIRDWRRLVLLSLAGLALLLTAAGLSEEVDLMGEIQSDPGQFAIVCLMFTAFIFMCVFAYSTVIYIEHKGWRALLIVLALAAFLQPFLDLRDQTSIEGGDLAEPAALGAVLAAVTIIFPQLVYSRIRTIRGWRRS